MSPLRTVFTLALTSCLALSLALPATAQRTCGTETPTQEQMEQVENDLGPSVLVCPGAIMVAFHVLHNGATGMLTAAKVNEQIAELNANYAPHGYTFVLGSLDYTDNFSWFYLNAQADEIAMVTALSQYPAQTLNIYSCVPYGYLGFSYFPFTFPENSVRHGVFIDYRTVPGGGLPPFDLGRTATHEIGHYLGLYHTFQSGCSVPGDQVTDTPDEASPAFGCPIGRDTCPTVGQDPIHNYMDYTDDFCYTEFTAGQGARMCQMVLLYRPSLITGGPTPATQASWGTLKVHYR